MRKFTKFCLFLFLSFFCLTAHSQDPLKRITINNDLEIIQLTPNTFIHVSYAEFSGFGRVASNGVIYSEGNKAFLFDTPPTDLLTQQLVEWIENTMKFKIIGFVPNHWHADCIGGLKYLQGIGIDSYANQMTIDIAKANNRPVPTHGFKDSLNLIIGNKEIKCYYFGAAHSMDNIVVWIPSEKILFAGCMVKELNSKNLGNTADGDLAAYPQTIEKVLHKFPEAKIVVPGHGSYGGIDLIKHTKELLTNK